MDFILWLIFGGLTGWVASMVMGVNGRRGILLNVVVGIVGAMLGGWLLTDPFDSSTANLDTFSLFGLVLPLLCAMLLVGFVRLARGATPQ